MSTQTISLGPDESIRVEQVGGDLRVEGWDRADLQARGDPLRLERRDATAVLSCGGNLSLSVPRAARLVIGSVGGDLQVEHLSGALELGPVGGDATLRDLEGKVLLGGMVGGELRMEQVANVSMAAGRPGDRLDVAERARRKVEQAARRIEAKVRRVERGGIHVTQALGGRRATIIWDSDAESAPVDSAEPASEEERLAILQMLRDHKITSEQAETLLQALDGNG